MVKIFKNSEILTLSLGLLLGVLIMIPLIKAQDRHIKYLEELVALDLDMSVTKDILTQLEMQKKEKK
ncbi:hypothetical protein NRK67_00495 [Fusobacteria bacterium ZRK30]|nr:hypothetical protein NRK67_00495 [Fusobacteria bacterium ZRK30]